MTMDPTWMNAILAMDFYNRSYAFGVSL